MPKFDIHPTHTPATVHSRKLRAYQKRYSLRSLLEDSSRLALAAEAAQSLGHEPFAKEQRPPVGAQGHPSLLDPPSGATERRVQNAQLCFVMGTMVSALLIIGIAAWLKLGPISAFVSTLLIALTFFIHGFWTRSLLVKRLLVFGWVLGLGELAADYFCVAVTQTLIYPGKGPHLWVSPAYMPFMWMVLMLQFGLLADVLLRRFRRLALVTALMTVLGGLYIPLFETLAHYAGAWYYHDTPMVLGTTPTYIILAEILLSAPLPWIVSRLKTARCWWQPSSWGLAQAMWVLASVMLAFWLVGD